MRSAWLAIAALALAVAAPVRALPADSASVAFALGPKEQTSALVAELNKQLGATHRFTVLSPIAPLVGDQPLDNVLLRLRKATKANWVFSGTVNLASASATPSATPAPGNRAKKVAPRELEVRGRLYDLILGDMSKEMVFHGTEKDWAVVAKQVVKALRARNPLHGEVTGLRDQWVLLNIGSQDGVVLGALFQTLPKQTVSLLAPPRLKIVEVQAWFSTAEVVPAGTAPVLVQRRKPERMFHEPAFSLAPIAWRLVPGDGVIEDVGYSLISPPKGQSSDEGQAPDEGQADPDAPSEDNGEEAPP